MFEISLLFATFYKYVSIKTHKHYIKLVVNEKLRYREDLPIFIVPCCLLRTSLFYFAHIICPMVVHTSRIFIMQLLAYHAHKV